jgi:hypothetical protein
MTIRIGITAVPLLALMLMGFAHDRRSSSNVVLGQEFKIKNGKEAVVRGEKLRIKVQSVSDSRCPTGATCIWAGNGEVVIKVAKTNKKQVVATLNTSTEPKEIVYRGFKIKLIALSPYPRINQSIDPKNYEATMLVTKNE